MKLLPLLCVAAGVVLAAPASGQGRHRAKPPHPPGGPGNGAPPGPHFNLNIIGVSHDKTGDSTSAEGNVIFVRLGASGANVTTKILLTQGPTFAVLDKNGTDGIAEFELPPDSGKSYTIWARALGKPGGSASLTTCADTLGAPVVDTTPPPPVDTTPVPPAPDTTPTPLPPAPDTTPAPVPAPDTTPVPPAGRRHRAALATSADLCSTNHVLALRTKGRQKFSNVTQPLTTISLMLDVVADSTLAACLGVQESGAVTVPLFSSCLTNWLWQVDNNGLHLLQLRFYPNGPLLSTGPAPVPGRNR